MVTDSRLEVREEIFEKLGRIAQTLGCAARLKIIHSLAQAPRTVEDLSSVTNESIANTSQHLQRLAREGIVMATRSGLTKTYRIRNEKVIAIWESLQDLAHEIAPELEHQVSQLADPTLQAEQPADEILSAVKDNDAILLDVRSELESSSTPVEHAKTIPIEQLKAELKSLNTKKPIYVFCRGNYCANASDAVKILRDNGFKAFRLKESSFRLNRLKDR